MLSHFNKLKTSLQSVHQYPDVNSQRHRFQERGWGTVNIWDLWEAWNDDHFLSSPERTALDEVEPFDEWEEFVLFARHYFVMHAKASPSGVTDVKGDDKAVRLTVDLNITCHASSAPKRRFGASIVVTNPEGQDYAVHTFGMGSSGRVASYDVYTLGGTSVPLSLSPLGPSARVSHTLTDLGSFGVLLTGGRASPTNVFSDCWLFKKDSGSWEKAEGLPLPLFRHSAVRLKGSSLALVFGGRTDPSHVSPDYFVFHPSKGWLKCATSGCVPEPTFGAVAIASSRSSSGTFTGLLSGGILRTGLINHQAYRWKLDITGSSVSCEATVAPCQVFMCAISNRMSQPLLHFDLIRDRGGLCDTLSVFGASVVEGDSFAVICGGVSRHASSQGQDIVLVDLSDGIRVTQSNPSTNPSQWPLMVGSAALLSKNALYLLGGGATCFSFGTFWETGIYAVDISRVVPALSQWTALNHTVADIRHLDSPKVTHSTANVQGSSGSGGKGETSLTSIPRVRLSSDAEFKEILRKRKPVIIEGLSLGGCVESWTPENMTQRLGETKEVRYFQHSTWRWHFEELTKA